MASNPTQPKHRGRLTLPARVRVVEREYIKRRRGAAGVGKPGGDGEAPLVGLALSGGGIRSATFCLGALQALASQGLLRLVDYLCTVSGGGYIGSCFSSLTTVREDDTGWKKDLNEDRASLLGQGMPLLRRDQIHHLRTHGDFLILRQGPARREVLRAVGTYFLGLMCSLTLFIAGLLIAVQLLFWYGSYFDGPQLWQAIHERTFWRGCPAAINAVSPGSSSAPAGQP